MGWEPYRVLARNVQNTNAVWVICMTNKVISYGSEKKKKNHLSTYFSIWTFLSSVGMTGASAHVLSWFRPLTSCLNSCETWHFTMTSWFSSQKSLCLWHHSSEDWLLFISSLKLGTAKQRPSVTLLRFFNSPPQLFGWEY